MTICYKHYYNAERGCGFRQGFHFRHNIWCRVSGSDITLVQLCHSLANQWPAACLRHTKVPVQLSWNLNGGETKKVPGTSYQILAMETQKKAGSADTVGGKGALICALPVGRCFQEVHTSQLPATVNNIIAAPTNLKQPSIKRRDC